MTAARAITRASKSGEQCTDETPQISTIHLLPYKITRNCNSADAPPACLLLSTSSGANYLNCMPCAVLLENCTIRFRTGYIISCCSKQLRLFLQGSFNTVTVLYFAPDFSVSKSSTMLVSQELGGGVTGKVTSCGILSRTARNQRAHESPCRCFKFKLHAARDQH